MALWADVERIAFTHGIHPKHAGFHRMLATRFPFGIYYREATKRTEIFAVLDLRQEPSWSHEVLNGRK